jgi:hypothetical protein
MTEKETLSSPKDPIQKLDADIRPVGGYLFEQIHNAKVHLSIIQRILYKFNGDSREDAEQDWHEYLESGGFAEEEIGFSVKELDAERLKERLELENNALHELASLFDKLAKGEYEPVIAHLQARLQFHGTSPREKEKFAGFIASLQQKKRA